MKPLHAATYGPPGRVVSFYLIRPRILPEFKCPGPNTCDHVAVHCSEVEKVAQALGTAYKRRLPTQSRAAEIVVTERALLLEEDRRTGSSLSSTMDLPTV
ncbi:hypothetical protein NYO67_8964 [Aspergillus flavus]|nr:hypothetical protein NYO67_8964 [Aspergillus flavus]